MVEMEPSQSSEVGSVNNDEYTVRAISAGNPLPDCKTKTGRTLQQMLLKEICEIIVESSDKLQNQSIEIDGLKDTVLKIKEEFEEESQKLQQIVKRAKEQEEKIQEIITRNAGMMQFTEKFE